MLLGFCIRLELAFDSAVPQCILVLIQEPFRIATNQIFWVLQSYLFCSQTYRCLYDFTVGETPFPCSQTADDVSPRTDEGLQG